MELVTAYLSLGSNSGDRQAYLTNAVVELQDIGVVEACSAVYETVPWGFYSEQNFYNICLSLVTNLAPVDLLKKLKEIEKKLGRVKITNDRYEARVIDIDIIFYGNKIHTSPELSIPHPFYVERAFVLYPLNEIAGQVVDPILGISVEKILNDFKKECTEKPIKHQIFINK